MLEIKGNFKGNGGVVQRNVYFGVVYQDHLRDS